MPKLCVEVLIIPTLVPRGLALADPSVTPLFFVGPGVCVLSSRLARMVPHGKLIPLLLLSDLFLVPQFSAWKEIMKCRRKT